MLSFHRYINPHCIVQYINPSSHTLHWTHSCLHYSHSFTPQQYSYIILYCLHLSFPLLEAHSSDPTLLASTSLTSFHTKHKETYVIQFLPTLKHIYIITYLHRMFSVLLTNVHSPDISYISPPMWLCIHIPTSSTTYASHSQNIQPFLPHLYSPCHSVVHLSTSPTS